LILWASAALAVGTLLQIVPWSYPSLLVGNALGGAGSAMWAVALLPLLAASAALLRLFPEPRESQR
jgi:hypothetical protein